MRLMAVLVIPREGPQSGMLSWQSSFSCSIS